MESVDTVKASLELYAVWELVDLMDAINEELRAREVSVETTTVWGEQGAVDPSIWDEYEGMANDED